MTPVQTVNYAYNDEHRLKAFVEISRSTLEFGFMKIVIGKYWETFVPMPVPIWRADQGEVEYVEQLFEILYARASLWHNEYRFKDIYERLAALEEFVGKNES